MGRKMPLYTKKKLNAYRAVKEEERQQERKQEEHARKLGRTNKVDEMLEGCRETFAEGRE